MSQSTFLYRLMIAAVCASWAALASAGVPSAPVGLTANVEGHRVTLTWNSPDVGDVIAAEDFEGSEFPQGGWRRKIRNTSDYRCTWFKYPTKDFASQGNRDFYIHSGEGSAMVYFDRMAPHADGSPARQDEWLISPAVDGASYLSFSYFIDPVYFMYAEYEDFNDIYCVKISNDGGTAWETIWDVTKGDPNQKGWQSVVLPLYGANENTKVAFVAQSNPNTPEMGLFFLWVIDDVNIYASKSSSVQNDNPSVIEGYNIYRDGELIAENITSLQYVDYSKKTPGQYTYQVVSVDGEVASEAAEISVEVKEMSFYPPSNVAVTSAYFEEYKSWEVSISWQEPEGDWKPQYYNVYCDGQLIATELPVGSFAQSEVPNGIFEYAVTAVYEDPHGESVAVGDVIALGTRFAATNLSAEVDGNNVSLSWTAPKSSDVQVIGYNVYRANTLVAESITDTSFTDSNVQNGVYDYNVVSIYADQVLSWPVNVSVSVGKTVLMSLPYTQDFNGQFKPENWVTDVIYDDVPAIYMWSFSNPRGIMVEGDGFDGGFASIDCYESGYYSVASTLTSPVFDVSSVTDSDDIHLTFAIDYMTDDMAVASLQYSHNGGRSWEYIVETFSGYMPAELGVNEFCSPEILDYSITGITAGYKAIMFRFSYDAMVDYHFALDNFKIYNSKQDGIVETGIETSVFVIVSNGTFKAIAPEEIEDIEIYAIDGSRIANFPEVNSAEFSVASDFLGSGIYIVKVTTDAGSVTRKISL